MTVEILQIIVCPYLVTDYYCPIANLWMICFCEYFQELYPEPLRSYHRMQLEVCLHLILFSLSQTIAIRSHIREINWH
jgi:hypothetical protein